MSAETLAKAFEPFFTTKGFSGTGLGLWVSQEIVDRHRGRLRLRSTKGRGTVLTIFLPFAAAAR
jgi:signal transduction histidine kinase